MASIPREQELDSSISLISEGYPFVQERVMRYRSDLFEMRLLLQKTVCIHGEEAAQVFYDPTRFIRKGAIPETVQRTLLGKNGIHSKDGEEHRHRKEMFLSVLMDPHNIGDLMKRMATEWQRAIRQWERQKEVVLFIEVRNLLTRASLEWAGIPVPEDELEERAKGFIRMIDAFGSVGFRNFRGLRARRKMENWAKKIIEDIRSGRLLPDQKTPAYAMAWHRSPDGQLVDPQTAAVELLNAVRPIIAVSYYICFSVLALHQHPEYRQKLQEGGDQELEFFAQEIRRFFPFAPYLGAIVKDDFHWKGYRFRKGTMVILDVYGTLHDPRLWEQPEKFYPERFRNWSANPFDFIPQGGGQFATGHRCPGEWITIDTLKVALSALTEHMTYQLPEQDLSYSLQRMPSLPKSKVILTQIRWVGQALPTVYKMRCPFQH